MNFRHSVFKKAAGKVGFTLAEVLVALTIIGIVAATVIPAVLNRTDDAESITRFKQVISDLSAATKKAALNGGGVIDTSSETAFWDAYGAVMNLFITGKPIEQILTVKYSCYKNPSAVCWDFNGWGGTTVILPNGAVLFLDGSYTSSNCSASQGGLHTICANIGLDVNGTKGPNVSAIDFFWLWLIKKNGEYLIVPVGSNGDGLTCVPGSSDDGCATNALMNNMP